MKEMTNEERLEQKIFMLNYYAKNYLDFYKTGGEKYIDLISDFGDVLCMELARIQAINNNNDTSDINKAMYNYKLKFINLLTSN
jgi:hypothetical protein